MKKLEYDFNTDKAVFKDAGLVGGKYLDVTIKERSWLTMPRTYDINGWMILWFFVVLSSAFCGLGLARILWMLL